VTGIAAPLIATLGMGAPVAAGEAGAAGAEAAAGAAARLGVSEATPGLLARAAQYFTAPGLIEKAGQAAADAASGAEIPGVLGKLAPIAASGAVQTGLYSGADVTERALLGDPDLTWQKAATQIGTATVLGGVLALGATGAAKGLAALAGKASDGLTSIGKLIAEGKDKTMVNLAIDASTKLAPLEAVSKGITDRIVATSTPDTLEWMAAHAPKIAEYEQEFPGLSEIFANQTPQVNQRILDDFKLRFVPGERDAFEVAQAQMIGEAYSSSEAALKQANFTVRPEERAAIASLVPQDVALEEAQRIRGIISDKIDELNAKPEQYGTSVQPQLTRTMMALDRLQPSVSTTYNALGDAIHTPVPGADSGAVFDAINAAKQQVGRLAQFDMGAPIPKPALAQMRQLYHPLRVGLEDTSVWGEAGSRQAAYNAAEKSYLDASKDLQQDLMAKRKATQTYQPKLSKVQNWINYGGETGTGFGRASSAMTSQHLWNYLDAAKNMAKQLEVTGLPEAPTLRLASIKEALQTQQKRATVSYLIKSGQPGHEIISSGAPIPMGSKMMMEAATRIPGGVGDLIGLIHGTYEKVRSPSTIISVISAIRKAADKASKGVDRAINGVFGRSASSAAAGQNVEHFAEGGMVTPDNFNDISSRLGGYNGNLDHLAEDIAKQTGPLAQKAPATATAAAAFATRLVRHLGSKIPQPVRPHRLFDAPYSPSQSELDEYNRHHEIAMRGPEGVLDHLADGTLSPEHVETSQALYPKFHAETQQKVMDRLAEAVSKGEELPRHIRAGLSQFLDSDLESGQDGLSIAATQMLYQGMSTPPSQAPQGQPAPQKRSRNVSIDQGARTATASQGVTSRLEEGA
jgi:hypothetical protein